ncbi:dTDP-4-dehydrorhamnose reductase [Halodesulfovibrio sp.]|uniref:dTDP-4-dehydrorhamnose reductase n=1 Tax=Halodesulfovibrio sp. TaxID=1912772 RepID=UPI0025F7F386|nr:dTDP-4-dehydrorhamnose reductase [Halodesulfovibrio sp.]MCT4625453.1 dTDP-4-dehydrorhamnose reductase [Halodesulfovibrio sp.]
MLRRNERLYVAINQLEFRLLLHGMKKHVIILGGKTGLLGQALAAEYQAAGYTVHAPLRTDFDTLNSAQLAKHIDSIEPEIVINAIGYTHVDQAEKNTDEAYAVNTTSCETLAEVLSTRPVRCISFSTDYIFSGQNDTPYTEKDIPNPRNVYAKTKLLGEYALLDRIADKTMILRTAWLFGLHKANFVSTITALSRQKKELPVIADQVGSPTSTHDLARACLTLSATETNGVYHITNSGTASWYELAQAAVTLAGHPDNIVPIRTADYNQQAPRPAYSALSTDLLTLNTGITMRPWKESLAEYVYASSQKEITHANF